MGQMAGLVFIAVGEYNGTREPAPDQTLDPRD
jgi:hypothetical protein